ncbi:BQ5605_C067g12828 [Microbotryum silenes-dioicae]|uniref:BQ5605_C067g12828 protein n=1 Tax=Microbotryum silenes-dioicae TaxID=796604 RepID=A0A2X0MRL4_9BASI|nr:BQ5605_C067g12828 [Microbotryum silenes-dioicae]
MMGCDYLPTGIKGYRPGEARKFGSVSLPIRYLDPRLRTRHDGPASTRIGDVG